MPYRSPNTNMLTLSLSPDVKTVLAFINKLASSEESLPSTLKLLRERYLPFAEKNRSINKNTEANHEALTSSYLKSAPAENLKQLPLRKCLKSLKQKKQAGVLVSKVAMPPLDFTYFYTDNLDFHPTSAERLTISRNLQYNTPLFIRLTEQNVLQVGPLFLSTQHPAFPVYFLMLTSFLTENQLGLLASTGTLPVSENRLNNSTLKSAPNNTCLIEAPEPTRPSVAEHTKRASIISLRETTEKNLPAPSPTKKSKWNPLYWLQVMKGYFKKIIAFWGAGNRDSEIVTRQPEPQKQTVSLQDNLVFTPKNDQLFTWKKKNRRATAGPISRSKLSNYGSFFSKAWAKPEKRSAGKKLALTLGLPH